MYNKSKVHIKEKKKYIEKIVDQWKQIFASY